MYQMEDLVSVVIPTYNRIKTLPNTIKSVLNQTYKNWELIVVDDLSTDNTEELMKYFSNNDSRIKYFKNKNKKGPSGARNCGIQNSSGKYIAFLDSDDEWVPNHLFDSIKALIEENQDVCFSLWYERDDKGNISKVLSAEDDMVRLKKVIDEYKPKINGNLFVFNSSFFEFISTGNYYCYQINTMVLKKDVIKSAGLFNEALRSSEDVDFITRVIFNYGFCLIFDYHFIYNRGNDNIYYFMDRQNIDLKKIIYNSETVKRLSLCDSHKCEMLKLRIKFIKKMAARIGKKEECLTVTNDRMAKKYLTLGIINQRDNRFKAVYYLYNSIIHSYSRKKVKYLLKVLFRFGNKIVKVDTSELNFL